MRYFVFYNYSRNTIIERYMSPGEYVRDFVDTTDKYTQRYFYIGEL